MSAQLSHHASFINNQLCQTQTSWVQGGEKRKINPNINKRKKTILYTTNVVFAQNFLGSFSQSKIIIIFFLNTQYSGHRWPITYDQLLYTSSNITSGLEAEPERKCRRNGPNTTKSHICFSWFYSFPIYIMAPIFHPAISWQIRCIFTSASLIGKPWKKIIANSKAALCWWNRPGLNR